MACDGKGSSRNKNKIKKVVSVFVQNKVSKEKVLVSKPSVKIILIDVYYIEIYKRNLHLTIF